MTLNAQNRQRLAAICNELRQDWEAALTTDGILELDRAHPNDPLLVVALTVAAARNPAANGPAFMAGKQLEAPPSATAPRNDPLAGVGAVWCDVHLCNTTLRDDGERVCCWQDRVLDSPARKVSPVKPYRTATPPPADFRARVATACGRPVSNKVVPSTTKEAAG